MTFLKVPEAYALAAKTWLAFIVSLEEPLTERLLRDRPLSRHAAEFWLHYREKSGQDAQGHQIIDLLLGDGKGTEPYRNWRRLFDLTKPWRPPNLERPTFCGPLYYACSQGLLLAAQTLVQNGAGPDAEVELYSERRGHGQLAPRSRRGPQLVRRGPRILRSCCFASIFSGL